MTMLTKNFQQLKAEVESHIAADSVAQGSYRTCFIGCLANQSDDSQYIEKTYGIPEMVSRIAESIFEGLPKDEAPAFFAALPDAVAYDGKDLSRVPWQFLAAELRALPTVPDSVQAAINAVIKGMDLLAEGKKWDKEDIRAAWDGSIVVAASAARAAASAARAACEAAARGTWAASAAVRATWATSAARAAASAASAASAACEAAAMAAARGTWAASAARAADRAVRAASAAVWAAVSAAEAAARRRQRDLLLKLISEAPIVSAEGE